jgi:hypothetical protein
MATLNHYYKNNYRRCPILLTDKKPLSLQKYLTIFRGGQLIYEDT